MLRGGCGVWRSWGRGWILNVWVGFFIHVIVKVTHKMQAHKVKNRRANWVNFQPIQSYITNHTTQPPLPPQMLSVLRDDVIHETRPRTIEQQKITTNKKSPLRHRRGMGDIILDYMGRFSIFFFSLPLSPPERKFINVPEGRREIGKSN